MPSKRLTLALNTNRNIRTVVLYDPSDINIDATLLKAAQAKLRIPKRSKTRFFIASTGIEITTAQWSSCAEGLENDEVVLVSTGEDFVGKLGSSSTNTNANTRPVSIINLAILSSVEPEAIRQLTTTAKTLPGIIHAVGQPDLHPGNKYPIGAAFVSQGWIHPPLIGGDIGCGMAWYKLSLDASIDGKKIAEKLVGVEGPWRTGKERKEWLGWDIGVAALDEALGTIGAGNHFADIQVVGEVLDEGCAVKENDVVLLVHSGSRGYGGDILKRFSGNTTGITDSLEEGSQMAKDYLVEHDRACEWATANRDLIALRFLECLEPQYFRNLPHSTSIQELHDIVRSRKIVDILHNNMQKVPWHHNTHAWIHRKGAAPTRDPTSYSNATPQDPNSSNLHTPLSLLPLPGSRATPTAIFQPNPGPHDIDLRNAHSVAHGAGRAMTRSKALTSLSSKYKNDVSRLLIPRTGQGAGEGLGWCVRINNWFGKKRLRLIRMLGLWRRIWLGRGWSGFWGGVILGLVTKLERYELG